MRSTQCAKMVLSSAMLAALAGAVQAAALDRPLYQVQGNMTIELIDAPGVALFFPADPSLRTTSVPFGGSLEFTRGVDGSFQFEQGKLGRTGLIIAAAADETVRTLTQLHVGVWDGAGEIQAVTEDSSRGVFDLPENGFTASLDPRGAMRFSAVLTLGREFAEQLGRPQDAGAIVGHVSFEVEDRFDVTRAADDPSSFTPAMGGVDETLADGVERICTNPTTGPDVIVGNLSGMGNFGLAQGISAHSVGTDSCNIGTALLQWIASTNQHPVIAQNMYRLKDGRFEQIGQSWLKHGFTALSGSLCCTCSPGGGGSTLGIGCSDPYGSGLNGQQSNLGPRWEVNTTSGWFQYPWGAPAATPTIGRRLQVASGDLLPSANPGAIYFVEGHYIAADEALFGAGQNDNNNASYRRITVSGTGPFTTTVTSTTQRQKPAMQAWQDTDSAVGITIVDNPGDGRFLVGYKATSLGAGSWSYEYAVQNLNSGRSGASFTVPFPAGATITNVGFRDVPYHSGDGVSDTTQDGTDWAATVGSNAVTWTTIPCAQNPNANALKWGTLYNFRFVADRPPAKLPADLGLFRGAGSYLPQPGGTNCGSGAPGTITAAINIPAADCNDNDIADVTDIAAGTSQDLNMNGVPDECEVVPGCPGDADGDGFVNITDISIVLINWFTVGQPNDLGDLTGDGVRDLADLAVVTLHWDTVCP